MTLVSAIVTSAYRESNLLAISADPTTAQVTEGVTLLNQLFYSVFGDELGENLQALPVGRNNISVPGGYPGYDTLPFSDWAIPDNTRVIANLSGAQTIYLNPNPNDGARLAVLDKSGNFSTNNLTIQGNGRTIGGTTSVVLSTDNIAREWFYRADLGDWKQVSDLVAADTWPFQMKYDTMFITMLAMRLNPRYGTQADPQTVQAMRDGLKKFRAQYKQKTPVDSDPALYRLTGWPKQYNLGGDEAENAFNSGRPY